MTPTTEDTPDAEEEVQSEERPTDPVERLSDEETDQLIDDWVRDGRQRARKQGSVGSVSIEWGPLVELGPGEPEPYPVDVLPNWLRRHVESVAESCQVPTDLPFILALTSLSVATANKARLTVRGGYTEPAHLWGAAVLPPASRKSPVYRHMTSPLQEWERDRAEEVGPKRRRKADQREVAEKALDKAKREAAKAETDQEYGDRQQAVKEARERLDRLEVPAVPRLVASDVTSEKLAELMAENYGRIAVLSPEGDIFRIMAGRYSGGLNIDHYKKGWTGGEPIRDDRMGREGTSVPRPALTLGLTVQPAVLDTLESKQSFRGEGLLGRFLYAMPDSGIGSRATGEDVPSLDLEAAEAFRRRLRTLLEAEPAGVDRDGMYRPHELRLSEGAWEVWCAFDAEVEEMLGPGGELEHLRDWGGKLVGHVTRTALLLHAADLVGRGMAPFDAPVSRSAMEGAARVGRVAVDHALRVFDRLEMDPQVRLARYVVRRLRGLDVDEPTVRDLHRACQDKKGLERVDALRDVLETLEAHNYVRVTDLPNEGPGRPPSPIVLSHPDATSNPDRTDRNGPPGGSGGVSVSFVSVERGAGREMEVA